MMRCPDILNWHKFVPNSFAFAITFTLWMNHSTFWQFNSLKWSAPSPFDIFPSFRAIKTSTFHPFLHLKSHERLLHWSVLNYSENFHCMCFCRVCDCMFVFLGIFFSMCCFNFFLWFLKLAIFSTIKRAF